MLGYRHTTGLAAKPIAGEGISRQPAVQLVMGERAGERRHP